jgi:hypothetical protein
MTTPPPIDWNDLAAQEPADDDPAPRTSEPRLPTLPEVPTSDAACQAERERVLRHPDIAKRLCDPPLRYSRPEVWNGFVPPETWQGRHNDAPQRAQLLEIITAAVKADEEEPI